MVSRIVLILALMPVVVGCGGSNADDGGRTTVVAAFYPLAYVAARVAGPGAGVVNLTPAGAEPHDLELSPRDVGHVRTADVVLYLGGGFQPALEEAVEEAEGRAIDLLPVARPLPAEGEEDGLELDPHVWLDPLRLAAIAERVGAALGSPRATAALVTDLETLDREFRRTLASCRRRELVTSHAAFGYLAERYGLVQIAVTGITPESEPSARDLERVVRRVRRSGATTVFAETLVSQRIARTVARETGARMAVLNPLEGLSEDELERGEDYLSVMRANLAALRRGLECR